MPGRWDRARLLATLRCLLVPSEEQALLFDQLFDAWFSNDELAQRLQHVDLQQALQELAERAPGSTESDTDEALRASAPPLPPTPPEQKAKPSERRRLLGFGALLLVAGLAVVLGIHLHRSSVSAPVPVASSALAAQQPAANARKTYELVVDVIPEAAPSWQRPFLVAAGGMLLFGSLIELWQYARRRRFRTPKATAFDVRDESEFALRSTSEAMPLSGTALDRLAFRTGLAVDHEALRLNVRETVKRAAKQAGVVSAVYHPRPQTRGISIVLPQQLEEEPALVLNAFANGLVRRGVPVHVTRGAPRWDTEDFVLVAVDARDVQDPPLDRWLTLPHVALLEVRDPALWANEVSALPRRAHAIDAEGLYAALEVAATRGTPPAVPLSANPNPLGLLEVEELGDAWPLAAACAVIGTCDLATADEMRRDLFPSVPFMAFQRVRRLRGVSRDAMGFEFSIATTRKLQEGMSAEFSSLVLKWYAQRLSGVSFAPGTRADAMLTRERAFAQLRTQLNALESESGPRPSEKELLAPLELLEAHQGNPSLGRRARERLRTLPVEWLRVPRLPPVISWRIFRLTRDANQQPDGADPAKRPRALWLSSALSIAATIGFVLLARPRAEADQLAFDLKVDMPTPLNWVWVTMGATSLGAIGPFPPAQQGVITVRARSDAPTQRSRPETVTVFGFFADLTDTPPAIGTATWALGRAVHWRVSVRETATKQTAWTCRPGPASQPDQLRLLSFPEDTAYDQVSNAVLNANVVRCVAREAKASFPDASSEKVLTHRVDASVLPQDVFKALRAAKFTVPEGLLAADAPSAQNTVATIAPTAAASPAVRVSLSSNLPESPPTLDCKNDCQWVGKCTIKDGHCVATSNADCRYSSMCKSVGNCTARDGVCVAATSDDCKGSYSCSFEAQCEARDGRCVATGSSCANSSACIAEGACAVEDGKCVPGSTADCLKTSACTSNGACTYADGKCTIHTNADCRRASACINDGACTYADGKCIAHDNADCEGATICTRRRRCLAVNGVCVIPAGGCRTSEACSYGGLCQTVGNECFALTNADCSNSTACKEEGRCRAVSGGCIK